MITMTRMRIGIIVAAVATIGLLAADIVWFLPLIHQSRQTIDSDRASTVIITEQQSNLEALSKNIETIKTQQAELDSAIWLFSKEDDFFTFTDGIAKNRKIAIDPPAIADATPNGTVLSRSVVLTLRGPIDSLLAAVADIQRQPRLIAIQKMSIKPAGIPNTVTLTINAITLWK